MNNGFYVLCPGGKLEMMQRRILAASSAELANEVYSQLQQYYPEHD